jgi:hypothetical protein
MVARPLWRNVLHLVGCPLATDAEQPWSSCHKSRNRCRQGAWNRRAIDRPLVLTQATTPRLRTSTSACTPVASYTVAGQWRTKRRRFPREPCGMAPRA